MAALVNEHGVLMDGCHDMCESTICMLYNHMYISIIQAIERSISMRCSETTPGSHHLSDYMDDLYRYAIMPTLEVEFADPARFSCGSRISNSSTITMTTVTTSSGQNVGLDVLGGSGCGDLEVIVRGKLIGLHRGEKGSHSIDKDIRMDEMSR